MPSTTKVADQPRTTITIAQLCLSPFNVRTNEADASNTTALEASLLAHGQIAPIRCHPMAGRKDLYGAHAGGRRYRSFKALIARGDLPADHPIWVDIRSGMTPGQLLEDSLAENLPRRDLRDYETYTAVVRIARSGSSVDDIAEHLGQTTDWVEGCLRLGELAEPIFKALAAEKITKEQARAFGATGDAKLQLAAWEQLGGDAIDPTVKVDRIRTTMKVGDAQLARLMRLVGEDVYLAAGGRIEPDLFADPALPRDIIWDEPLLQNLADRRLDEARAEARLRVGRPNLQFVPHPPKNSYHGDDYPLQVTPQPDGDHLSLPDGDVVARIYVDEQGAPIVDYWWASRSAKAAGSRPARAGATRSASPAAVQAETLDTASAIGHQFDNARQVADAAIREDEGLSADGVKIFRSVRRQILRGLLVNAAERGSAAVTDYLVWTQLRLALDMEARPTKLGVGNSARAPADPPIADEHVRSMPASAVWKDALAEIAGQSFITSADLVDAFDDYCASNIRLKQLAAAIVTGFSIEGSLAADGYVVPLHDALARHLGVLSIQHDDHVRQYWTPTEKLLGLIPNKQALAIAKPFVTADAFGSWLKAKAGDVTRRLVQLVNGHVVPGQRADRAAAAADWIHPLLRFCPPWHWPDNDDAAATKEEEVA